MGIQIGWFLFATLASSGLYRAGGKGGFKNAKAIRRFGCPLISISLFLIKYGFVLHNLHLYLLTYALSYGAMTTYWDMFAPDGTSEDWKCWIITGTAYGLACIPLIWAGVHWYGVLVRSVILGLSVMFLRENTGSDILEETGTGALYILTQPIMYI